MVPLPGQRNSPMGRKVPSPCASRKCFVITSRRWHCGACRKGFFVRHVLLPEIVTVDAPCTWVKSNRLMIGNGIGRGGPAVTIIVRD